MLVGIGVVIVFALIGLGSAGAFMYGKVSGSPSATPKHRGTTASALAAQDLARARAQSTAIVSAAQSASQNIVTSATKDAKRRANSIVAAARNEARGIVSRAQAAASAASTTQGTSGVASSTTPSIGTGVTTVPTATTGGTTGTYGATGTSTYGSTGTGTSAGTGTTTPGGVNLSGLPSSWLVVAYNATFGSGPGSVGGVSVINRGHVTFTGVVTVRYANGGSASASFAGLAPGQSEVLPLSGQAYTGGGYTLHVTHVS